MKLVIGIGCDRGISLQTLKQAIDLALQSVNSTSEQVSLLATIDQKSRESAILELAKQQHWRLQFYPSTLLAEAYQIEQENLISQYAGVVYISQAAALLAANTNATELLIEGYKYRGADHKNATISIAQLH